MNSPCVNTCKIDPNTNLCVGCKRTLEEIANWLQYTAEQKQEVLTKLTTR
jgi:predicted Fe-S protein YdhL (DUF1289 family)